jgi:exodeoxyribonuclease-3
VRWLARIEPWDVVCLQEIKAHPDDVPKALRAPRKSHAAFHHAQKKGYSGVALYARRAVPVRSGFGSNEFDAEGRYLEADFGKLTVISVYLPSGSSSPDRQLAKSRFLAQFLPHLERLRDAGREVILGDWNIAHQPIDLKNWRSNQKNSGFLPEERAWLTRVFDELGFVDVFRRINREPDQYTWWSNRGQCLGEERRLAHRLPDRDGRHRRDRRGRRRSIRTGDFLITLRVRGSSTMTGVL